MYTVSILFSIVHVILSEAIMQEKEIKEIPIGKSNYTIYRWLREPKTFIRKPRKTVNKFRNVTNYRIHWLESIAFLYTKKINIQRRSLWTHSHL